ncbi:hypothetical protein [Komagataeibacter kakiaceti]|nr:hypothetical protein [Komagataeibacter kakiaceti]
MTYPSIRKTLLATACALAVTHLPSACIRQWPSSPSRSRATGSR